MKHTASDLTQRQNQNLPPLKCATIHWTDLVEAPPNSRIATEWDYYRKHVGQLLDDGHEGKWVLIKGEAIIGIWDTEQVAKDVRLQLFPNEDVILKQILEREPIVRGGGYDRLWHS